MWRLLGQLANQIGRGSTRMLENEGRASQGSSPALPARCRTWIQPLGLGNDLALTPERPNVVQLSVAPGSRPACNLSM